MTVPYKENLVRYSSEFSAEYKLRESGIKYSKILKESNHQSRIMYPMKLFIRCEWKIKALPDKQKLREFTTTGPALQEMFKGALPLETNRQKRSQIHE